MCGVTASARLSLLIAVIVPDMLTRTRRVSESEAIPVVFRALGGAAFESEELRKLTGKRRLNSEDDVSASRALLQPLDDACLPEQVGALVRHFDHERLVLDLRQFVDEAAHRVQLRLRGRQNVEASGVDHAVVRVHRLLKSTGFA